jgi:hypothetical protein
MPLLDGEEEIPPHLVLGQSLATFPSRRLAALLQGWSVLIGLGILLNFALQEVTAVWVSMVVVFGMGGLGLVIGWRVLHLWNREVILFERGFTFREGSAAIPFQYREIKAIKLQAEQLAYFGGLLRRRVYLITLTTRAGDTLIMNNVYQNIESLADKLPAAVNASLRLTLEETLARNETMPFGDALQMAANGLSTPERPPLLWTDFGGYRIANRQIHLLHADQQVWASFVLADVENLMLLVEVLRERHTVGERAG